MALSHSWVKAVRAAAIAGVSGCLMLASPAAAQPRFDVNDAAVLWPAPAGAADVAALLSAADLLDGGARLWPQEEFSLLLTTAEATTVDGFQISFKPFRDQFLRPETWKVVALRIDPSAPGGHESVITQFGSTPQVRMVLQPVTVEANGAIKVHDFAAHLAYSFVTGVDPATRRPIANEALFRSLVQDVSEWKAQAGRAGIQTGGPLGVHPALARKSAEFAASVRAFVTRRLPQGRLTEMAFMGIRPPEPWMFFGMARLPAGWTQLPLPSLGGKPAQLLSFIGRPHVVPPPQTTNVSAQAGVSTAPLFDLFPLGIADRSVDGVPNLRQADVPDLIANPRISTVRNTDCVSCHTESRRRAELRLTARDAGLAFARPANISGVSPDALPKDEWNTRNFGWFQRRDKSVQPTVTMRTANEVAEAVELLNAKYLGAAPSPAPAAPTTTAAPAPPPPPAPVANGLTLVMTIKPGQFANLKMLIEGTQRLPPDRNPIAVALTSLRNVHFARFVFFGERQLAVITEYDGSFEDYIDAFVNALGDVFDQILQFMDGWPPNTKVSENRQAFLEYVRRNDLPSIGTLYSAYPHLSVREILSLEKQRQ